MDKIKSFLGGSGGDGDLGSMSLGGYEKYLKGATYPLGIDDLVQVLKNNGAPSRVPERCREPRRQRQDVLLQPGRCRELGQGRSQQDHVAGA